MQTFAAFLDFCYIARRDVITEGSLEDLKLALQRFHQYRIVFSGTARADGPIGFSLPRQHSMVHYHENIKNFGAPNGLCSSITESKHIAAVKRPWRRSSRYKALSQILKTNERLDKLAAAKADFTARGMLAGSPLTAAILDNNGNGGDNSDNGNDNDDDDSGDGDGDEDDGDDDEDDDDAGPVESEPLMNEVRFTSEKGDYRSLFFIHPKPLINYPPSSYSPIPTNTRSPRIEGWPTQPTRSCPALSFLST